MRVGYLKGGITKCMAGEAAVRQNRPWVIEMFKAHSPDGFAILASSDVIRQQRFAHLLHEHVVVALECRLHIVLRFQLPYSILRLQTLPSTCFPALLHSSPTKFKTSYLKLHYKIGRSLWKMVRENGHLEGTHAVP